MKSLPSTLERTSPLKLNLPGLREYSPLTMDINICGSTANGLDATSSIMSKMKQQTETESSCTSKDVVNNN